MLFNKSASKDATLDVSVVKVPDDLQDEEELGLFPHQTDKDLSVDGEDVALAKKMFLINNAIDEIGFTWYHAKLFCIAGLGYSADSQLEMIQSTVKTYVDYQFGRTYPVATEIFYMGLIVGSAFWGFGGDIIGRKTAFNYSLLSAAAFGFFAGGMNSYATYCIFLFLNSFSAGGNIALDIAVFLEYLPFKYQWLTTLLAGWWGVGQTIAALIAWAFIPKYSCKSAVGCESHLNRGWRYCWYVNSGLVMVGALIRLFFFKLDETPKFLVSNGRDAEAVESLRKIAEKYNRPFSLTVEQLEECGQLKHDHSDMEKKKGFDWRKTAMLIKEHIAILFYNKLIIRSTVLIFLSWFLIGISYSTFYNFVYIYIGLHGGVTSSTTYRNTTIDNFVGIFGPIVGGFMVLIPRLGRRGTMAIGAISCMAILFGYTTVRTPLADVGFGLATYFFFNIYYGCLYAYTPEVFPASARTTGCALALVIGRISGAFAPVVYFFGQKSGSAVPLWVCGACIGLLSIISLLMPFEPSKKRTV